MMRCWLVGGLMLACGVASAADRRFAFPLAEPSDPVQVAVAAAALSEDVLEAQASGQVEVPAAGLAQLRIVAGQDAAAVEAVRDVMAAAQAEGDPERARRWLPYLLHARASSAPAFAEAYAQAFRDWFRAVDDLEALRTQYWFGGSLPMARDALARTLAQVGETGALELDAALELVRQQAFVQVLESSSRAAGLVAEDEAARYTIEEALVPAPGGATLSALVARSRRLEAPLPAALQFTIYADPAGHRATALQAAARGYAGVVVDARGKRLGSGGIRPYEHEAEDATAAIDWVSRQSWSDGRVGMHGGSYSGFAAWAATKRRHPALRTIVPIVAAIPGQGVPMENNVFLFANYAWAFYVGNNRLLDNDTYFQRGRWDQLAEDWYASGRAFREIDQVDGTPNPWLQRWLQHPAYDAYWQAMVPYGEEFAGIDIPVLSITGYYDDSQVSALQWYREHLRHRPDARHYLVIGPYDHFGAQAAVKPRNVNGYPVDPVARFDSVALTYAWFDHVFRDAPLPALLRDRVNYQLMGSNEWRSAPSLDAAAEPVLFHLAGTACGAYHCLARTPASTPPLRQQVDFADRSTEGHGYYPYPALRDAFEPDSGVAFASEAFTVPTSLVGAFSGELKVRIDKRDFDFSVSLYELIADGRVLQLSYYLGRASHARDMSRRELLVPGEWTVLPFERTRMNARRMEAGSRLLAVVDVVKDARHQVNMGTGRDVSDETIADAVSPLHIEWHPDSVLRIPLREESAP